MLPLTNHKQKFPLMDLRLGKFPPALSDLPNARSQLERGKSLRRAAKGFHKSPANLCPEERQESMFALLPGNFSPKHRAKLLRRRRCARHRAEVFVRPVFQSV